MMKASLTGAAQRRHATDRPPSILGRDFQGNRLQRARSAKGGPHQPSVGRLSIAAILSAAATFPAQATEPAHCYTKITPDNTDISPPADALMGKEPNPFLAAASDGRFMNTRLSTTLSRATCNFDISKDIAYWTEVYRGEGCSDDSPIAKSFRWFWTTGVDEQKAEKQESARNAPRDSNGLVAESYMLGVVHYCMYLYQIGAQHLSIKN